MTDKQVRILNSGLTLFATKGYAATSTNEVAKLAEVSEALVFRHFGNKEGLLSSILKQGEEKVSVLYNQVLIQANPKDVIRAFIELPFKVPVSEYNFWKLLYTLKWEIHVDGTKKVKPIKSALASAFKKIGTLPPEMEADFLINYMDGLITAILRGETKASLKLKNFLKKI